MLLLDVVFLAADRRRLHINKGAIVLARGD